MTGTHHWPRTQEQLDAALRAWTIDLDAATLTGWTRAAPQAADRPGDYAW